MDLKWRKGDWILVVAIALAAVALVLGLRAQAARAAEAEGAVVRITVDGEELGTYPLEVDRTIPIDTERGHNLVRIEAAEVHMEEADCPDQTCIHQGQIRDGARSIICLPHRVVVEIVTDKAPEVDTVAS